jgi:hypothetical protein
MRIIWQAVLDRLPYDDINFDAETDESILKETVSLETLKGFW